MMNFGDYKNFINKLSNVINFRNKTKIPVQELEKCLAICTDQSIPKWWIPTWLTPSIMISFNITQENVTWLKDFLKKSYIDETEYDKNKRNQFYHLFNSSISKD